MPALPSSERPFDALCLGLNACDHLCLVDKLPDAGGKLRMSRFLTCGGGQAATAACTLARLGYRAAYGGVCGDDEAGRRVRPWLEEFGVKPLGLVTLQGTGSQQAFIMVEENDAERTIVWFRDEACRLEAAHLDPELIASCRILHLDGHFLEASLEAARLARAHDVLVSLDGEKVYPGTEELVSLCHVVVGCEDFAQRLTGRLDPGRALETLSEMGPVWVGRTLGERGAELMAGGEYFHQRAFTVTAVDTTGAGDVFHAGLVHALLQGQGPQKALATASACAAISITALGGRNALPDLETLNQFLITQNS